MTVAPRRPRAVSEQQQDQAGDVLQTNHVSRVLEMSHRLCAHPLREGTLFPKLLIHPTRLYAPLSTRRSCHGLELSQRGREERF